MFKFNSGKLLALFLILICSFITFANAESITLNNKNCSTGASYKTVRSTERIRVKSNRYYAPNMHTEEGSIGSYSYKEIDLDARKGEGKVQVILVHYKNSIAQLWLNEDKLCIINSKKQKRCKNVDFDSIANSQCAEIQICPKD